MRRRLVNIVIMALLLASAGSASASRLVSPESGKKMWLLIGGKQRRYYRVESGDALRLTLNGAAHLKCIVRAIPADSTAGEIPYRVVVRQGNKQLKAVETSTRVSNLKWRDSTEGVGLSRKFSLELGRGRHVLEIRFSSPAAKAAGIRFLAENTSFSAKQSRLYPQDMAEALTLVVNERLRSYYLSTTERPVSVKVIGPTRLRVITRLVYGQRDRGSIRYGINVLEESGKKVPHFLTTRKSLVAESKSHPDWTFGRPRSFAILVPKGKHHLVVVPQSKEHDVILRFTIPKESLKP